MSSKIKAAGLGLVLLVLAAVIGWFIYHQQVGRYLQSTNDAAIQADQVTISAKLSGYVRQVAVEDNAQVAAGSLLVAIDPLDYQTKMAAAQADMMLAQAAKSVVVAAGGEAEAGVVAARAQLAAAQSGLDFATREWARIKPLVDSGAEAAATLSQYSANRDRAAAEVAAQSAALLAAQRRLSGMTAQGAQAGAKAQMAQVQAMAASNDLAATRLVSPLAGRVAGRSVRVGQFVAPGMRLMTIVPTDALYVVANFKETQVGLMRAGQIAVVHVDALPDVAFKGTVVSITPGTGANFSLIPPQNATGNFTKIVQRVPVRIRIDAGPAARAVLAAGMSVTAEVDTRSAKGAMDALRDEQARASRAIGGK
ncbi:MAG: hypothetical protein RLY97_925 [Pseudomonadota bacterium]|jgi:membrane fusion protein (multidrug efflux system)